MTLPATQVFGRHLNKDREIYFFSVLGSRFGLKKMVRFELLSFVEARQGCHCERQLFRRERMHRVDLQSWKSHTGN